MQCDTPRVDVVGVGSNATDTLIVLPRFPTFNSKVEILSLERLPGGQVASALVACRKWGLRARYIGKVGDDDAGKFQRRELEQAGVEVHLNEVPGCPSQVAYSLVDKPSGERTILWKRDRRLEVDPEELDRVWIISARALHVDGHDTAAAAQAARWAREVGIPVTADVDNVYPGVEALLENVDYLLGSREFPAHVTGEADLLKALPALRLRYGCRVVGAALGELGVLAWDGSRFVYSPGFVVKAVDTTGAGDIFHGAFLYGLLAGWPLERSLEFSCAAAALNCTALGARGGIQSVEEIERFVRAGQRSRPAYDTAELERVRGAAPGKLE
jgi:sugar/nucleoside kinase (ribokinase family)